MVLPKRVEPVAVSKVLASLRLIGAESDEVAYTKNVSEGLNIIAAALD